MMRLRRTCIATAITLLLAVTGCEQRMAEQPKYGTLEASPLFPDQQAALHPPLYTVSRDQPLIPHQPPAKVTVADIERGQQRYRIYCVPCHGELGDGTGPVVARGFPAPPSYHNKRLREAPLRHFYEVISHGYGVMYAYADRVAPPDRWRIALYIRALQQSQYTRLEDYSQFQSRFHSRPDPAEARP